MPKSNEPRKLAAADEIGRAVIWRLIGIPTETIPGLVAKVRTLPVDLGEHHPEVSAFLSELAATFPRERRIAWTLLCALAALADYKARGAVFWLAGMSVLGAMEKSRQKAGKLAPDLLSSRIAAFKANRPDAKPSECWETFKAVAMMKDEVIADFNDDRGVLIFQPDADCEDLSEITMESFARRFRRTPPKPDNIAVVVHRVSDDVPITQPKEI